MDPLCLYINRTLKNWKEEKNIWEEETLYHYLNAVSSFYDLFFTMFRHFRSRWKFISQLILEWNSLFALFYVSACPICESKESSFVNIKFNVRRFDENCLISQDRIVHLNQVDEKKTTTTIHPKATNELGRITNISDFLTRSRCESSFAYGFIQINAA